MEQKDILELWENIQRDAKRLDLEAHADYYGFVIQTPSGDQLYRHKDLQFIDAYLSGYNNCKFSSTSFLFKRQEQY